MQGRRQGQHKKGTGYPALNHPARNTHSPARPTASPMRRRRLYLAGGAVGLAFAIIAVLLSIGLTSHTGPSPALAGSGAFRLDPASIAQVEGVPAAKLLGVANGEPTAAHAPITLPAGAGVLAREGKPEILYVGANYCPYCAAERWAVVMALSKFGTFSDLMGTSSSTSDVNPSTPTFTFYGSKYESHYLSFVAVETAGNTAASSGAYPRLESLTATQAALLNKWDAPPYVPAEDAGSVPFLDLGGKYVLIGSQYDASHIAGWTFTAAASYLTDGNNATSRRLLAAAGQLTQSICTLTSDRPTSVCKG